MRPKRSEDNKQDKDVRTEKHIIMIILELKKFCYKQACVISDKRRFFPWIS